MQNINGIYLAFFTGEAGTTLGIFMIRDGIITGGDQGGGTYDGEYKILDNFAEGIITFATNAAGYGVTGAVNDLPVSFNTPVRFELPIEEHDYHSIETMGGPINARFEKIRSV